MSAIRIGDIAPNFMQNSTHGLINFHRWLGNDWGLLFSHPCDFTPVCTTELGYVARLAPEFARRGVKVLGLSVDSVGSHLAWIGDVEEIGRVKIGFPILGDIDRKVALLYGMIHPNASRTQTVRSVFVVDPDKRVRAIVSYPESTGRDFDEVLRVIDALQLSDVYSVATPVNWKDGEDVIVVPPEIDSARLKAMFPKGCLVVKPYLRTTAQPNR
jgi:alkyl hydroperoxide reductase subunit AhpC